MQRPIADIWPAWSWRVLVALALVDGVWLALSPIDLEARSWISIAVLVALAGGIKAVVDRVEVSLRIQTFALGLSFMLMAWPVLRILNHLTMSVGLPLTDAKLAAWDAALGLDWFAYVAWVDRYPKLLVLMNATYQGLTLYSLATFLVLLWLYGAQRAREFVLLFFLTAILATLIGMLFPADAAMAYFRPDPSLFRNVTPAFGTYHLEAMQALRSGQPHLLSLQELPGLVTFPSFHTAMGVVGIYCCRGRPLVLALSLAVNGTMIAATPVFGSHYLVDPLGGIALALFSGLIVTASERRAGWPVAWLRTREART